MQVTITGSNTNFSTQSVVSFGAGLTVTSITVGGPATLAVNVNIAPGATVGPRDVTVTTNGTPVTGVGMFTVTAGTPRLVSVSPNTVTQGQTTTLTITGEFTNFQQGVTQVSLGQGITIGSTTISSPTSIAVVVTVAPDATLGSRTLTITTGAEQLTLAAAVTVAVSGPALTLIDPNSARPGQSLNVRIVGSLTHFTQAASQVNFGAGITVNSVSVVNGTSLNANLTILPDATLGGRTVTVTTGAEVASLANGFFVLSGGQAQPLSCVTNAGVPPLVRAEGFTELVVTCSSSAQGAVPVKRALLMFSSS